MGKFIRIILALIAVVIAFIGIKSGYHVGKQASYPVAYSEYIVKYAHEYDLDPYLVMAVIKVESNFVRHMQRDLCSLQKIQPNGMQKKWS